TLVLEPFDDLIGRNFFHVDLGYLLVFDRAQVTHAELTKTQLLLARGGINGNRNINQPEADAAFPNRKHNFRGSRSLNRTTPVVNGAASLRTSNNQAIRMAASCHGGS